MNDDIKPANLLRADEEEWEWVTVMVTRYTKIAVMAARAGNSPGRIGEDWPTCTGSGSVKALLSRARAEGIEVPIYPRGPILPVHDGRARKRREAAFYEALYETAWARYLKAREAVGS